jgi:hypothetical protein
LLWEVVDEIPRSASGKFRVTVNHVGTAAVMPTDPVRPERSDEP